MANHEEVFIRTDDTMSWRDINDLASENNRLLGQVDELASANADLVDEIINLRTELATFRQLYERDQEEVDLLERQLLNAEGQSRQLSEQSTEVGWQNTYLASLYAASSCLHESRDRGEVLDVIRDIIHDLIGSQELAVFEVDPESSDLSLAYSTGLDPETLEGLPVGTGVIGRVAESGEPYLSGSEDAGDRLPAEAQLTAAIPLKLGRKITGVIAVFQLLPDKGNLATLDRELLELLANQAGTSLYHSSSDSDEDGGPYLH